MPHQNAAVRLVHLPRLPPVCPPLLPSALERLNPAGFLCQRLRRRTHNNQNAPPHRCRKRGARGRAARALAPPVRPNRPTDREVHIDKANTVGSTKLNIAKINK